MLASCTKSAVAARAVKHVGNPTVIVLNKFGVLTTGASVKEFLFVYLFSVNSFVVLFFVFLFVLILLMAPCCIPVK